MKNHFITTTRALLSGLLAMAFAYPLLAMETDALALESDTVIEEITVTGQRTLIALRLQGDEAEDAVYELFNELNTDDAHDVHCAIETRFFSRIKERHCRTGYELDAMEAEARYLRALATGEAMTPPIPANIVMAAELPKFQARMKELVEQNPVLLEAVIKHAKLREELRKRHDKYFDKD